MTTFVRSFVGYVHIKKPCPPLFQWDVPDVRGLMRFLNCRISTYAEGPHWIQYSLKLILIRKQEVKENPSYGQKLDLSLTRSCFENKLFSKNIKILEK